MDTERRVVVTGLGIVSALGLNVPDAWSALEYGQSGITELEGFDTTKLNFTHGGQIKDFDPRQTLEHRVVSQMDRFSLAALVATQEAVADAGIEDKLSDHKTGIILGTASG